MSEHIVITNHWQINELNKANLSDLRIGIMRHGPMGEIAVTDKMPSKEQFEAIYEIGTISGESKQVRWLYDSARENIDSMMEAYDLREDGCVKMPSNPIDCYRYFVRADALFHSIVASAKCFIDKAELLLKTRFGESSESFKRWKSITAKSYDNSLVYALLYDLRNHIEHDFWTVSLVNHDVTAQRAGLAINIDNGLFGIKKLKKPLRTRLCKWSEKRAENGETAWLSLGKCVLTYREMITALYAIWISEYIERTTRCMEHHKEVLAGIPGNLLIWDGEEACSYSASGQLRAYHITETDFLDSLKKEQDLLESYMTSLLKPDSRAMAK